MTSNCFEAIFDVCIDHAKHTGCLIEACMSAGCGAFKVLNEPGSARPDNFVKANLTKCRALIVGAHNWRGRPF